MNLKKIAIGVVATLIVIAIVLIIIVVPSARMPAKQTSTELSTPIASAPKLTTNPGAYIDYAAGIIASTSGTKILFFHAPWCPQCQALEKDIKATTLPDNVTIIKVDYDTQNDLRVKYGVTLQTTLIKITNDGEIIKKFVAYNEPSFQSVKSNLLD